MPPGSGEPEGEGAGDEKPEGNAEDVQGEIVIDHEGEVGTAGGGEDAGRRAGEAVAFEPAIARGDGEDAAAFGIRLEVDGADAEVRSRHADHEGLLRALAAEPGGAVPHGVRPSPEEEDDGEEAE